MVEGGAGKDPGQGLPPCAWHPSRRATAMCVYCRRPVCPECDRLIGFRHYCPICAAGVPAVYPYAAPAPPPRRVPQQLPEPADAREKRWWRADWGLLEVFIAWLVIFGIYNIVGIVLYVSTDNPLFYNYVAYAALFCPLVALSVWLIPRRHKRGREELGVRWGDPGRTFAFGGLGALVAIAMSYGVFFIIYFIFYLATGRSPVSAEAERLQDLGGGYLFLIILIVVVLAPIFEELFFRGLFYPALRSRMGPWPAIVLNGAIFGILHLQPLFVLSLILVGIALAYLYEKTDSLAAPMIAHSLYNLVVILVSLLAGW